MKSIQIVFKSCIHNKCKQNKAGLTTLILHETGFEPKVL